MEEPKFGGRDPKLKEKTKQLKAVDKFFKRFENPDGSLRGGWIPYNTPTEFRDLLGKHLRSLLKERLQGDTGGARAEVEPTWSGSPYPGLRSFTSEQAPIFFGRGREVDALISRLRDPAQRFLAVVGASGSGKSSLVHAGLLPRLANGAIEGSQHWRMLTFTPGDVSDNPFYAKTLLADQPADAVLVLFIDQFEELFTPAADPHRKGFVEFLARAAADPRLRVIITLRADFLPQCTAEPALAALLQAGTFVLGAPGPAALADIIRKPAERAGLDLEEGLADEIVKDAGADPGALPLVAFCLEELYEQTAPEHHLTLEAYLVIGGLRGAIGRRADALLEEFRSAEAAEFNTALPEVFRALIYVDAAGKAARQRAAWDELMVMTPPAPQLTQKLVQGRLLQAEEVSGRAVVMLAHEALIQEWPALSAWLGANQAQLQRLQRAFASLTSSAPNDRAYAVSTLGEIGPVTPDVVPALIAALGDVHEDAGVRRKAAEALGGIGSAAAAAVPALIAALDDVDEEVHQSAAAALGEIGPAAAAAVPALIAALGNGREDADVRQRAAEALGRIGPVTPEVVPALVAALGYANQDVRWSAKTALRKIKAADVSEP
jgi:hypothetical protein